MMGNLEQFAVEVPANIRGCLFDIDDTITTNGRLTADAYAAIAQLNTAGLIVIPITGRPAGWCDHIARMWPIDGVVGENGAFYFAYDHAHKKMQQRFVVDAVTRKQQRHELSVIAQDILRAVPGCALASDQAYREADIAIDFCEDVPRLAAEEIARIRSTMEARGLTAKVSSIHVNGWFGDYDKYATTALMLRERFDIDLSTASDELVFVGDSPNDQPMFEAFRYSVGVANVCDFESTLTSPPKYIANARSGAGFVEVVDVLLRKRAASNPQLR
jgi:HAD superfamily hydrolase (TIGR01484 family)